MKSLMTWTRSGEGRALIGASAIAVAVVAILTFGCGRNRSTYDSASTSGSESVGNATTHDAVPASSNEPVPASVIIEESYATSPDSLPPEVAAHAAVTTVTPGHVVQISAEGSADVREVVLTDDLGQKRPFAYDAATQDWRVFYRVPMKSPERLALSVTAKNGSQRWRRVWLFLDVREAHELGPLGGQDSSATTQR